MKISGKLDSLNAYPSASPRSPTTHLLFPTHAHEFPPNRTPSTRPGTACLSHRRRGSAPTSLWQVISLRSPESRLPSPVSYLPGLDQVVTLDSKEVSTCSSLRILFFVPRGSATAWRGDERRGEERREIRSRRISGSGGGKDTRDETRGETRREQRREMR
ncbi:hypothetical protein SCHPADRAFT_519502 [Schizopora paradoxa]|uniref:Uncharacterized protein n=1 Tax=Schizopora paradoxa TaxID=27342 RepID=A0A0H2RF85_9AGAM|nr:hypothetical protein SCHPADRAFT_519502 [Schizopora paradoxa]